MKSTCGVLYQAIKSSFHQAMKRNGHNPDYKGELTSRNTLHMHISNPHYGHLAPFHYRCVVRPGCLMLLKA